ncbi:growth hormone secretagogue receptor type 1-like [Eriocheir sinensis]|uniref:growth hormone secretagogue receptor type 1-like n=1 Tax=Eriocheir sinensis TaxID=95602 RepID=UPI0021C80F5B|nr:growth hormone secretagogue receptor type 1-like [Eriocheir sinensis]
MEVGLLLTSSPGCMGAECGSGGEEAGEVRPAMLPAALPSALQPSLTPPPEDMAVLGNSSSALPDVSFPAYMQGLYTAWCLLLLIVGLLGNMVVPVLVVRDRELRAASTSIFIVNLVAADLLVLVVCLPTLLSELYAPPSVWVLPPSMCKVVPYVEYTVAHASMLTILAISVERYRAICHPLTAAATCSRARAAFACLLVWVLATCITSPVIALTEYTYVQYIDHSLVPVCFTRVTSLWAKVFVVSSMAALFFLPLVVLVLLYWRIARQLLLDDKQLCKDKPNPNLQARKQVVVMLGTVVVVFFVCLLPHRIFSLWFIFTTEIEDTISTEVYFNLLYAFRILVYVNSAINPVLYNVTSSKFRGAFFRLLGLRRGGPLHHTGTTTAHNTTVTGGGSTHNSLVKSSWRGQKLVVRCSYTCMWREGERRPLVDRQPHSPHTWGHTNPAGQTPSPATSPFLTRACPRPANRHLESFV